VQAINRIWRERFSQAVRPTTYIESDWLDEQVGCHVLLAVETFQRTGSFKFRGAFSAALQTDAEEIIAASSGNFGQALALSCRMVGQRCLIVMPANSAQVKVDAVRRYGAEVDLVDVKVTSRQERVAALLKQRPGMVAISPYDNEFVIEGNSSLGEEIADLKQEIAAVIVPVGGGGLISGVLKGLQSKGVEIPVFGAEPLLANDAARSMREGQLVSNPTEPQTIADGARTISLGKLNYAIIKDCASGIVEVPEEAIIKALGHLFQCANLKVEPTGALAVGALLCEPTKFKDKTVVCIVSGGNVDPGVYANLLLQARQ